MGIRKKNKMVEKGFGSQVRFGTFLVGDHMVLTIDKNAYIIYFKINYYKVNCFGR